MAADEPVEGDDEDVEAEDGMGTEGLEKALLVNILFVFNSVTSSNHLSQFKNVLFRTSRFINIGQIQNELCCFQAGVLNLFYFSKNGLYEPFKHPN